MIRTGLRLFTPKKRFYAAKQVYRFVRPGFQRISVRVDSPDIRLLAFADPGRQRFAIVGMNGGGDAYLNIRLEGFPESTLRAKARLYRTSATENCALVGEMPVQAHNWPFDGLVVEVKGCSIFTVEAG